MYSNIVLGHTLKDYNKNLSKYFIAVYNEQILINFFFLFSNLKKNLVFLLNLYLKKHSIFFFSSNFLTNKLYTKTIYTFEKINWIKGLISNQIYVYKKIVKKKKRLFYKFPGYFFFINKEKKDFKNLLNEFKKFMLPLTLILDSNIKGKFFDDILYIIPGNDNSAAFSNYMYTLCIHIKEHSKNLQNLKIIKSII